MIQSLSSEEKRSRWIMSDEIPRLNGQSEQQPTFQKKMKNEWMDYLKGPTSFFVCK